MDERLFKILDEYIGKVYPEFLVDNCIVEHDARGGSLYSGGELIGRFGFYGWSISFYRFESSIVENVDSIFGDGVFNEWFKITYHEKIYNVNLPTPPF